LTINGRGFDPNRVDDIRPSIPTRSGRCATPLVARSEPLLDPTDKATFGFVYDGTTMTFSGSYHDRQGQTAFGVVDVAFKGTGVMRPCTAGEPVCARAPALGQKGGCLFGST